MKILALLQTIEPEIAVLQLSNEEHTALHTDALGFVNSNQVFGKQVNKVDIEPHAPKKSSTAKPQAGAKAAVSTTWTTTILHWPGCTCKGACVSDAS